MLELPENYELISFFECEPHLGSKDTPWEYNSITFKTLRGQDYLFCKIEPDVGDLEFIWSTEGIKRVHVRLNSLKNITINLDKDHEYLIASGGDSDPKQLLKIRIKPYIAIELFSIHDFMT